MTLVRAVLINRTLKNGWEVVHDDIELGRVYWIDIDSLRTAQVGQHMKDGWYTTQVVQAYDMPGAIHAGWMHYENPQSRRELIMTLDEFDETIQQLKKVFPALGSSELLIHLPEVRPSPHTYAGVTRVIISDAGWLMVEINHDDIYRGMDIL